MKILNFDEVDSTNDLAFRLAAEGLASHHTIITAQSQTKGRGRHDRSWSSPAGNLYFSLLLQLQNTISPTDYSFLAACVIGDVLHEYKISTKYKWPNDIIFHDKKLAGILLQFQRPFLVIGVGLNLVSAPSYAISLEKLNIAKEDFLQRFSAIFAIYEERYLQFGFATIKQRWKEQAYKIGEKITLSSGASGMFVDIDNNGNLLLQDELGKVNKIVIDEIL